MTCDLEEFKKRPFVTPNVTRANKNIIRNLTWDLFNVRFIAFLWSRENRGVTPSEGMKLDQWPVTGPL